MKTKTYPVELINKVTAALAEAPPLPPKYKDHQETIQELTKQIRELHTKKNYDARQIVQLLKQNGIKTTLKEVRNLIEKGN